MELFLTPELLLTSLWDCSVGSDTTRETVNNLLLSISGVCTPRLPLGGTNRETAACPCLGQLPGSVMLWLDPACLEIVSKAGDHSAAVAGDLDPAA